MTALAIVAPPRALADLRHAIRKDVKDLIFAEIDKDLTKHPITDIERHLSDKVTPQAETGPEPPSTGPFQGYGKPLRVIL